MISIRDKKKKNHDSPFIQNRAALLKRSVITVTEKHFLKCFLLDIERRSLQPFPLTTLTISGGRSTQIKYWSKSTDTYNKILLQ